MSIEETQAKPWINFMKIYSIEQFTHNFISKSVGVQTFPYEIFLKYKNLFNEAESWCEQGYKCPKLEFDTYNRIRKFLQIS